MYNSHVSGNAELLSVHSENDIAAAAAVTATGNDEYRLLEGAAVKAEREAYLRQQCEMAATAVAREAAAASCANEVC